MAGTAEILASVIVGFAMGCLATSSAYVAGAKLPHPFFLGCNRDYDRFS